MKNGFTLIELLVTVFIISLLAAIAYPSYKASVVKGNRTTAQGDLEAAAAAMAIFRAQNFTYAGAKLGANGVFRDHSPDAGATTYDLSFAVAGDTNTDSKTFTILATPHAGGPQVGNGALGINQAGERCWNKSSDTTCTPGDADQKW